MTGIKLNRASWMVEEEKTIRTDGRQQPDDMSVSLPSREALARWQQEIRTFVSNIREELQPLIASPFVTRGVDHGTVDCDAVPQHMPEADAASRWETPWSPDASRGESTQVDESIRRLEILRQRLNAGLDDGVFDTVPDAPRATGRPQ